MKSFYFAPHRDSFRLTKKPELILTEIAYTNKVVEPTAKMKSFYIASQNGGSFRFNRKDKLVVQEISHNTQFVEPATNTTKMHSFYFAPIAGSFKLREKKELPTEEIPETSEAVGPGDNPNPESENNIEDSKKRNFLKVAGMAGLGLAATSLFPNKADALILGGTPTSSVVGSKNASNVRINPATEETLDEVLKTSDLTFDAGSLQVKVTSLPDSSFSDSGNVAKKGLVDADRHLQVDVLSSALPSSASTETTLQTISFGGFKFALRLATVGEVDYVGEAAIGTGTSSASWRIKKVDSASGVIIQWAGTGVFDQVWDNRASLSYS